MSEQTELEIAIEEYRDGDAGCEEFEVLADAYMSQLDEQEAVDEATNELISAAEIMIERADYIQGLWGKEGVTYRMFERLRAAVGRVKGGAR